MSTAPSYVFCFTTSGACGPSAVVSKHKARPNQERQGARRETDHVEQAAIAAADGAGLVLLPREPKVGDLEDGPGGRDRGPCDQQHIRRLEVAVHDHVELQAVHARRCNRDMERAREERGNGEQGGLAVAGGLGWRGTSRKAEGSFEQLPESVPC